MSSETSVDKGKVQSDVKLDGKTVVITGANSGIGFATALGLARRGAKVIMACRDLEEAQKAEEKILEDIGDAKMYVKKLDLASLASVHEFANDINTTEERLDVLINNAGVMMTPQMHTKEGYEMQLGVNHIGHFLLTSLLLDLLKKSKPSRVVTLSCGAAYKFACMNWGDIMYEDKYNAFKAYVQSKLANIHHSLELSRRLEGTGVTCYVVDPGSVATNLGRHMNDLSHLPFFWRMFWKVYLPFSRAKNVSPEEGAQTSIYCAIEPELSEDSGKYYTNCKEAILSSHAKNVEDAQRLWTLSEEWTKVEQPADKDDVPVASEEKPKPGDNKETESKKNPEQKPEEQDDAQREEKLEEKVDVNDDVKTKQTVKAENE